VLADGEEGGALWLLGWGEAFPLGSADGAEEDGVGVFANLNGRIGEGFAFVVDSGAAYVGFGVVEFDACGLSRCFEDVEGDGHYFWTDVVTGKNCEFYRFHGGGLLRGKRVAFKAQRSAEGLGGGWDLKYQRRYFDEKAR